MMLEVELLPLKTQHPTEDGNDSPAVGCSTVAEQGTAGQGGARGASAVGCAYSCPG